MPSPGSSGTGAQPVFAGLVEPAHGGRKQRPAPGGPGDHGPGGRPDTPVGQCGEGGDPGDENNGDRDNAVGADPAVAHDPQLGGFVPATAEPVSDIGQPVFVQCAGQPDHGGHAEGGGDGRRHAGPCEQTQNDGAHTADAEADQREEPDGRSQSRARVARFGKFGVGV